jgi:hypothetical protein
MKQPNYAPYRAKHDPEDEAVSAPVGPHTCDIWPSLQIGHHIQWSDARPVPNG